MDRREDALKLFEEAGVVCIRRESAHQTPPSKAFYHPEGLADEDTAKSLEQISAVRDVSAAAFAT